jgi:hypothetical protein
MQVSGHPESHSRSAALGLLTSKYGYFSAVATDTVHGGGGGSGNGGG